VELSGGIGDFGLAFAAGVVSFLSPCVLPLVPGYLSFVTGMTPSQLEAEDRPTGAVLFPSLLFILGFTIVFVALGAGASALGDLLLEYEDVIQRVLGVFVFAMGFLLLGIVRIPWLYGEARFDMTRAKAFGGAAAVVMGMAFALGWTPCVGPMLSAILALSLSSGDVGRGAVLLGVYSMGLGLPLLAVGLLFGRLRSTLRWLNRRTLLINRIAGVVLLVLGALIFFDRLTLVANWFQGLFPALELL
jgi:cytochrome c-type biogenesis protein